MKDLRGIHCVKCKNYKATVYKRELLRQLKIWRSIIKQSMRNKPVKKLQSYRKGKLFGIERAIAVAEDIEL